MTRLRRAGQTTVIFSGVGMIQYCSLLVKIVTLYALGDDADLSHFSLLISHFSFERSDFSGGYCGGVPPLPIPNREVKPACADGTAMQCGRVGGRHFFLKEALSSLLMKGLPSIHT